MYFDGACDELQAGIVYFPKNLYIDLCFLPGIEVFRNSWEYSVNNTYFSYFCLTDRGEIFRAYRISQDLKVLKG